MLSLNEPAKPVVCLIQINKVYPKFALFIENL